MRAIRPVIILAASLVLVAAEVRAQGQDLGHKIPGGIGFDAGTQADEGIYLGDRYASYTSDRVNDRDGDALPVEGLKIRGLANVIGLAGTLKLENELYLSAAIAVPVVRLSLSADEPNASVDRFGLGTMFVEPLKVGRRFERLDLVSSYSVYVPTGQAEKMGLGRPQWAHQLAGGGTVFFDEHRGWRVSMLATYVLHHEKQGIEIRRGDTLAFQGGFGARVFEVVDIGFASYALWQVTDDTGAELPDALRGARERVFGLGPEIDVMIPELSARLTARCTWDFGAEARPDGRLLTVGITFGLWRPARPSTAAR